MRVSFESFEAKRVCDQFNLGKEVFMIKRLMWLSALSSLVFMTSCSSCDKSDQKGGVDRSRMMDQDMQQDSSGCDDEDEPEDECGREEDHSCHNQSEQRSPVKETAKSSESKALGA